MALAFISELIEQVLIADMHAAATPEIVAQLGLQQRRIGSGLVSIAAGLSRSSIYVNRTIALGLSQPASEAEIKEIVAAYRDANVERFLVHVHPAARPAELEDWLTREGLARARAWQKFRRGREAPPRAATDLAVREVGAEHGKAFAGVAAQAFDLGDLIVPWLERLPGRAEWHVFMTFDGDDPAGTGALFERDGVATIEFGATAPRYRSRGSQGVLLARRIERALDLGCREIFTTTGVGIPGDPQHSYRNILKAGFREDYVRENFAPPQ